MDSFWYRELYGDDWEDRCHALLSLKHGSNYQPIGDKGGDLGLDGLSLSEGIAYQAYGQEPENKDPAQGVKNKIHADLAKLKKNQNEILELVGKNKIKRWLLLINKGIPHNSIHQYAKNQENEVKSWQLEFIDSDFQVIIQTPSYFETESLEYHKKKDDRIEVEIANPQVSSMSNIRENEHFMRVFNKFRKITDNDLDAENLALDEIKNYFENAIWLDETQKQQPEFYSSIEEVRSDVEADAKQGSIMEGSFVSFSNTKNTLETRLINKIGARLGTKTLENVRKYIIADWFVRCPLNFKQKGQKND